MSTNPLSIGAICLDLDDTLWPVTPVIQRAEACLMQWLGEHCPRVTQRFSLEGMRKRRDELLDRFPQQVHNMSFIRRALLGEMLLESGYGEDLAEQAFAVFYQARNQVELYHDVLPALHRLSSRFPLVAVSNGNADVSRIGLGRYFIASVLAQDIGLPKPHGAMFDAAARCAGVAAEQVLHVGDDPHTDVHGARQAGMQVAWLDRHGAGWNHPAPEPDWVVSDLQELANGLGLEQEPAS